MHYQRLKRTGSWGPWDSTQGAVGGDRYLQNSVDLMKRLRVSLGGWDDWFVASSTPGRHIVTRRGAELAVPTSALYSLQRRDMIDLGQYRDGKSRLTPTEKGIRCAE